MANIQKKDDFLSEYQKHRQEHVPSVGDAYIEKSHPRYGICRLVKRCEDRGGWDVIEIDSGESRFISDDSLKSYYHWIENDVDEILEIATQLAEHKISIEDLSQATSSDDESSEALISAQSSDRVLSMLNDAEKSQEKLEEVLLATKYIIEVKQDEIRAMLSKFNKQLDMMKDRVKNLVRIITVLNLYTGATIDINQICDGEPARKDEPLSIRQRTLYMDEELCVYLDHEADYTDVPTFFDWLKEPKNLNIIAPEPRCVVCLKPKRYDRGYRSNDYAYDRARELWNHETYVVLRNGEKVFWFFSDDLYVEEKVFPFLTANDDFVKKFNNAFSDYERDRLCKDQENTNYYVTKFMVFIQGLLDQRPDIMGPVSYKYNVLKLQGVTLVRDAENTLGSGLKPWKDFRKEKNGLIRRGTRILYRKGEMHYSGRDSWDDGGKLLGYNRYNNPPSPDSGLYHSDITKETDTRHGGTAIFMYNPKDKIYGGYWDYERHERKRCVAWCYEEDHVLNYDATSLDELRAYMEDRTQRIFFANMMPLLKKMLFMKIEEKKEEDAFVALMRAELKKCEGVDVKDEAIEKAIEWWKGKVIFSRPLRSDDAKAWRMIKSYLKN